MLTRTRQNTRKRIETITITEWQIGNNGKQSNTVQCQINKNNIVIKAKNKIGSPNKMWSRSIDYCLVGII